jgi:hypothetical protein
MIQLDDLYFFLTLIEDIQNRTCGLRYLLNLSVRDIGVLLLVQKLNGLCGLHVKPTIEVSFSFFVGDSVCDQWVLARWLLIEHEEVEIVRILLVGYYQQQILPNFSVPDRSFDCKLAGVDRLVNIDDLHLFLTFLLKHIPSFVQREHVSQIGDCGLPLMFAIFMGTIEYLSG